MTRTRLVEVRLPGHGRIVAVADTDPIGRRGAMHISRVDPRMARVIQTVGPCKLERRRGRYQALVRAIVAQQVSAHAARAIFDRLRIAAGGVVTAKRVAALQPDELRSVGLSARKADYIGDLSERVLSGELDLAKFTRLDDDEVRDQLTAIRGIGRWTAEMFLMFVLNRPDVLPLDDVGLRRAVEVLYGTKTRPTDDEMIELTEAWRPFRTVGCWYLWRSLEG